MIYNFNEIIERRDTLARKWSKENLLKEFQTDDVLPMWIADMDIACPPPVVAAMQKVIDQRIYGYTFVPDSYYQAVIDWNRRRHQWTIKKDWITLTHGTVSTLHYIVQAFCQSGDKIITQTPGYQPFQRAVMHHQCELLCNPLIYQDGTYEIDFGDLEEKARDPRTKMMIFCNPHNPTGRVWTAEELSKVAQICLKHDVLLVSDEIHKDISLYGNRTVSLASLSAEIADNCIICVSPNKAFNFGGLKSSYTVIPNESIRSKLQHQLTINSVTSPNVFAVPALIAAYTECDDWLDQLQSHIEKNVDTVRSFLAEHLPLVKMVEPESTYLIWLDVGRLGMKNSELMHLLIFKGKIAFEDGNDFIADGEGFIRMNVGCPHETVVEALRRMASCF